MKTKKRKELKTRDSEEDNNSKTKKRQEPMTNEEKPFDFGGLPNRDLKKNLGCG